jgi:uncharacterized protein (TIGR04255 family)
MGKKYAKPPLVEAVCEFRVSEDTKWDLTVAGLLYEQVRDSFPIREQRLVQNIEIRQSHEGVQQQTKTEERVFFFNNERSAFIQVGARLLAVNCLKPYPEWDKFREYINQGFSALKETIDIKGVNRVGLRYINRIDIPHEPTSRTVNLDTYFDYRPFLGERLPQQMLSLVMGVSLPFEEGRDHCRILLTGTVPELPNHQAFTLDLDYASIPTLTVPTGEIDQWIDTAHHNLETVFEGCINEPLRELFQEVK